MSEDKILQGLNASQKEAVGFKNIPLLIIAGAGSGKTKILVHRIAHLIQQGVPSYQILGVTFTNKAANEMKQRVQRLVQQEVWVSTFHSTCLKILRMDGQSIGLDRYFSIYDEHDQLVLVKECIRDLKVNEKQVRPKGVVERIQRAKDSLITPAAMAEQAADLYEEQVRKIYELYEKKMAFLKACDFGDLISKTVQLFYEHPAVLQHWQNRFQHILIDEYQDTNHAQYRLVKQLAALKRQITVVGDPDQSIYSWRGADIQNILNFEKDYPECGIIKLERNYRSSDVILDAANELISRNTMRKPKNLWTDREGGEKITIYEAINEKAEAEYVVNQITRYLSQGKNLADQVVFYRVHAQSRILEDMLRRSKIPYKIIGGVKFYDRMEIKDLVAYLRVVANPSDEISLKRIVNVPARGVGKKAIELIENRMKENAQTFYEVIGAADTLAGMSPKTQRVLKEFHRLLEHARAEAPSLSVTHLLEMLLRNTHYVQELEQEKTVEAQARIENIQEFFSVIQDFEDSPIEVPEGLQLQTFLESISLVTDLDQWDQGTNVLTLMTLHTAKGLEFPIVYMVGLEEGIFPNFNSYTDQLDDLEEERRLCYVGMTRAKDKLFMLFARQRLLYGTTQRNLPSRFLNEIPGTLIDSSIAFSVPDLDENPFVDDHDVVADYDSFDSRKNRILYEDFDF